MIYFSNSDLSAAHMTFIGRWDPFHTGHENLIRIKQQQFPDKPILIQVRMTATDTYTPRSRAEFIKLWMLEKNIHGSIAIVPNIEGIYWGRDVGYKVEHIDVDEEMKNVSATKIRNKILESEYDWEKNIPTKKASNLLNPTISQIMENGLVIWLTGCPSAGKTTIGNLLNKKINAFYPLLKTQQLDGDIMRNSPLAKQVGFTPEERAAHISRMGYLSKLFADHGILVISSFVSPELTIRNSNRDVIGINRYIEVYVKASKITRINRDVKGLYKKAIAGKINNLTGFNAKYEEPKNPSVICDTDKETVEESVNKILHKVFQ